MLKSPFLIKRNLNQGIFSKNNMGKTRTEILIIGSGFGGSVAALRYAEAGYDVVVMERGDWISRETFEADTDMFWIPKRGRFGMNELRSRGRHIIPWLGAGVGGGSHVYAATIKRRAYFSDFPKAIRETNMDEWYDMAEDMLDARPYPNHPPYSEVRANQMMRKIEKSLADKYPDLVEDEGQINLAISFAPENKNPGETFMNKYGAEQRYADPMEQKLLGGDIDSKNTLDKNYLFLAQKKGAQILAKCEAKKIEQSETGYLVTYHDYSAPNEEKTIFCKQLILAAGSIGSTQLLMQAKFRDKTLSNISKTLGDRYFSNGDYVSLILPFKGVFIGWFAFALLVFALIKVNIPALVGSALLYFGNLFFARQEVDPDIGTTNSDYIRFKAEDGTTQGVYIEGGRYPTLLRFSIAFVMSIFGWYRPSRYRVAIKITNVLRSIFPPFELLARTWPTPLLQMGRDQAVGSFTLNQAGEVSIDYPLADNTSYYKYLDKLGKMVAREANAYWLPNIAAKLFKKIEVPHNLGGVCMGDDIDDGSVDHAGRVFGYTNLAVLDGSIIPVTLGPNPAGTIVALSERAVRIQIKQLLEKGVLKPE